MTELKTIPYGNALGCKISRFGGFDAWAERCGLPLAQHDSRRGWAWEEWFVEQCRSRGMSADRVGPVKSPYDVLVGGRARVDVKSAEYAEYGTVRGNIFRIHNKEIPDFIAAVCLEDAVPFATYIIPAGAASRSMLTIVRSGGGKYEQFRDAWHLLDP